MAKAYILIGNSGCGKGTQAKLLMQTLVQKKGMPPFYVETGAHFRELIQKDGINHTATLTHRLIEQGKLPPSFLGVHMWSELLVDNYAGQDVIIDGAPRVLDEVPLLLGAADFYGWDLHVVYISVRDEWAHARMVGRGRDDDKREHDVWGRIQWFYESVVPAIDFLHNSPLVTFHTVQGEQTPDQVHTDICHALQLV